MLVKVTAGLEELGRLDRYAIVIGQRYDGLALNARRTYVALGRDCPARAHWLAGLKAIVGTWAHRALCRVLGVECKEQMARVAASLDAMTAE